MFPAQAVFLTNPAKGTWEMHKNIPLQLDYEE